MSGQGTDSLGKRRGAQASSAGGITMAAAAVPHDFSGGHKRKDPADSELSRQSTDRDENVKPHTDHCRVPDQIIFSVNGNTPYVPQSRRRRYTQEERLEVAETRKRGACANCRKSRTKVCLTIHTNKLQHSIEFVTDILACSANQNTIRRLSQLPNTAKMTNHTRNSHWV